MSDFKTKLASYLRENLGAPFIAGFMLLLLVAAAELSFGLQNRANQAAIYGFYSLVIGIVLQILSAYKTPPRLKRAYASKFGVAVKSFVLQNYRLAFICAIWLVLTYLSYSDRIYDYEVINILSVRAGVVPQAGFVPQLLGEIAVALQNSVQFLRLTSAIFVLATAIFILECRNKDDIGLVGALLFLVSFYTVRYGFRFLDDPFVSFFGVVAVYYYTRKKPLHVGAASGLALLNGLAAIPLFPVLALLTFKMRLSIRQLLTGFLPFLGVALILLYLSRTSVTNIPSLVPSPVSIDSNWLEFLVLSPLVIIGIVFALRKGTSREMYFAALLFLVVSLVLGFTVGSDYTQYLYLLNAIICPFASAGLIEIFRVFRRSQTFVVSILVIVILGVFVTESYAISSFNLNHGFGIQDTGYKYDQELLSYFDHNYAGGAIYSNSPIGLLDPQIAAQWTWLQHGLSPALTADPPWLVTYQNSVALSKGLTAYSLIVNGDIVVIGPYLVIQRENYTLSSLIEVSP